jgi:hypothetical protein
MNDRYLTLAASEDSPDVLKGCLWVLAKLSAIVTVVLLSGIGMEHTKMLIDEKARHGAEEERDAAYKEKNTEIQNLNGELTKAQTARETAESKLEAALAANAQDEEAYKEAEAHLDQVERELAALRVAPAAAGGPPVSQSAPQVFAAPMRMPSVNALTPRAATLSYDDVINFVKGHLARMTGPPEGQLSDYAAEVDFHDKPHASLQDIANDRERWAEQWPRRIIQMTGVMPEVELNKDASYGWEATVLFDWNWLFTNRSGMMLRGVDRDTWKIVPTAEGMKIIFEHSVDASTGRARD